MRLPYMVRSRLTVLGEAMCDATTPRRRHPMQVTLKAIRPLFFFFWQQNCVQVSRGTVHNFLRVHLGATRRVHIRQCL